VTASIPTTEPALINAGDTAKWFKTLADYPASTGWVLSYALVNASVRLAFSGAAAGDDFLVTVAAATTASWAPGAYDFRATVTKSGEVFTVGQGRITVAPAFGAAIDARSSARRMLEAVEATVEGRASSATAEYEIAGRKLRYIPVPELLTLRDRLRQDVAREDAAARIAKGLGNPGRVYVRFGA
jgi:hypothetical protein